MLNKILTLVRDDKNSIVNGVNRRDVVKWPLVCTDILFSLMTNPGD